MLFSWLILAIVGIYLGITVGDMYAFIQYINRLFDPLIEVTQNFSILQTSMVSAGRVFALIDQSNYEPVQADSELAIREGIFVLSTCVFL